ncbi:hypothetical protein [Granulicella sibirica]|uniref:Uncharacterized protein n=1 Tax=Granulicella sibirica TaxID=2479048 RepID=A0A4Q0T521_9BACT|nr:hypothetical protein [Granulicella sibirica]RXH57148.1 hypothetical protein GRAN_0458 [Granulicella sibirica]
MTAPNLEIEIKNRLAEEHVAQMHFSPAIEEAIRLSEMYKDIEPENYVLPLDAMAGFFRPPSR